MLVPPPPCEVLLVAVPPCSMEAPPLGLACLRAYLEQNGVICSVFDVNALLHRAAHGEQHAWLMANSSRWLLPESRRQLFAQLGGELDRLARAMLGADAPMTAISVFGTMQYAAIELIERLRALGYRGTIVLGGPACFTAADRAVFYTETSARIDALVSGEGEQTFLELVLRRRRGEELAGTPGAVVPRPGGETLLVPRPFLPDLDALPFPSFAGFDLNDYGGGLAVQWSRGCVRRCAFCENHMLWGAQRAKSAGRIYEELRHLREVTATRSFSLCDTAFNTLPRLEELCQLLTEQPLDVRWSGSFLALPRLDPQLMPRLRRAGCDRVEIGVESGSDRVLRLMRKGTTVAASEHALRLCHDAGIFVCVFLLVGFPGELEEDFQLTLGFLRRNRELIDLVRSVNVTVLQRGTEIMEERERYGITLPPQTHLWGLEWCGPDGNTPDTRRRRLLEAVALLDDLGLRHELKAGIDEAC